MLPSSRHALLALALVASPAFATTWVVTDAGDAGDGTCDASCTLRDAVNESIADDRILFDLALPNPLQLDLTGDALFIDIPLRITANDGVPTVLRRTGGSGRLIELGASADVRIVGLGYEDGNVLSMTSDVPAEGGAIFTAAGSALELRDCRFRNNQATGVLPPLVSGAVEARGGAIATLGDLIVDRCSFVGNLANGANGLDGTMVAPNSAGSSAYGGAIYAAGAIDVLNSTFSGNQANGGDGGDGADQTGFPGGSGANGGNAAGGALYLAAGSSGTLGFATLMGNDAVSGTGGSGGFGTPPGTSGLIGSATGSAVQADADLILNTSVVMGAGVASACEGMAITQRTANLVSDASCPGTVVTDLDLQFQPIDSLDPSPHFTPLPTSDAVDTSPDCLDPLGAEAVVLDQLIATRPMTYHAAPVCDFGAIEFTPVIFADGFETPPPPP
ncbi:MAG: hypothetical protein KDI78_15870 [Xanthomonadales bacterium]|nr:hypothetical protein [Xanthomonadales bacterium]